MDIKIAKAKLESTKREALRYRNWAALMTVTNLFLVIGILFVLGSQRTVLTNIADGKSYWVTNDKASVEYLRSMASNFVAITVNIHPKSVNRQHEKFLKYVDPSVYGALKTKMDQEAKRVRKDAVSQTFYEQNVVTSHKKPNAAIVIGIRKIFYGDKLVSTAQARYLIQFKVKNGQMYVSEYKELNKDEKPFS